MNRSSHEQRQYLQRRHHHRGALASGLFLLLLGGSTTVIHQVQAGSDDGVVSTDKLCYESNEDIIISFHSTNPGNDDWVGIYPSIMLKGTIDPWMWLWTCGTQDCWGKINGGRLTFGAEGGGAANFVDEWPLDVGEYRAVLGRDSATDPDAYNLYAMSEVFNVVSTSSLCSNPTTTTTPSPTTQSPTSPAPTRRPSFRPSSPPSSAPARMSPIIAAAKQDIGYLILAKPSLSALFLRMVFHDCVGGCDGCINLSNPNNARLEEAMTTLAPIVATYEPLGLTRPDIWVLASMTGVEMAMPDTDFLAIPMTTIGRQPCDSAAGMTQGPNPDMASPNFGTDDLLSFFRAYFGFTPQETAAIMGGHTIGVMRRQTLGYDSIHGHTVNNKAFNNGFYAELIGAGTTQEDQVDMAPNWQQVFVNNSDLGGTVPDVFQWEGWPDERKIAMMNADIALVRQLHDGNKAANGQVACQFVPWGGEKPTCPMARSDLFTEMVKYRNDNRVFLEGFRDALTKMTQSGYVVDTSSCDSDGICRLTKL